MPTMQRWFFVQNETIIAETAQTVRPQGWVLESEIPSGTADPQGLRSRRPLWPSGATPVAAAATVPQSPVLVPDYRYHAIVIRDDDGTIKVVDGDTIDLMVDCGFETHRKIRCRLLGVNCPEVKGPTKSAGDVATEYTRQWLADHAPLLIQSRRVKTSDAFHRYLVTIWGEDGACLNDDLLATHNAVPFRE